MTTFKDIMTDDEAYIYLNHNNGLSTIRTVGFKDLVKLEESNIIFNYNLSAQDIIDSIEDDRI